MTELTRTVLDLTISALVGGVAGYSASIYCEIKRINACSQVKILAEPIRNNTVSVRIQNNYETTIVDCVTYLILDYDPLNDVINPTLKGDATVQNNPWEEAENWPPSFANGGRDNLNIFPGAQKSIRVLELDEERRWVVINSECLAEPYRVFLKTDKKYSGTLKFVCRGMTAKVFYFEIDPSDPQLPMKFMSTSGCFRIKRLFATHK